MPLPSINIIIYDFDIYYIYYSVGQHIIYWWHFFVVVVCFFLSLLTNILSVCGAFSHILGKYIFSLSPNRIEIFWWVLGWAMIHVYWELRRFDIEISFNLDFSRNTWAIFSEAEEVDLTGNLLCRSLQYSIMQGSRRNLIISHAVEQHMNFGPDEDFMTTIVQ